MKLRFLFPFVIFIFVAIILWRGLSLHPTEIPSPLVGRPVPEFSLPLLNEPNKKLTHAELKGQITLINVWATWCYACAFEHDFLLQMSKSSDFVLYGLSYKDNVIAATNWLQTHGNPYKKVMVDASGDTAINFGVYGSPETFIIDKKGMIRYKQTGPITEEVWQENLKPIIDRLRVEA